MADPSQRDTKFVENVENGGNVDVHAFKNNGSGTFFEYRYIFLIAPSALI